MTVNLSVKDVPDDLAQRLRERAARNHRSLQGELMAIIEQAVAAGPSAETGVVHRTSPQPSAVEVRGWKTIEHLIAERRATGWKPHPSLAQAPLAVDIVRADRDSR
ncbi:MAG: FitA-like ribbon-helix-helix domain-containing protein [Rubrivivax sp.]|jgi:plasmid stability protein